jgi:hypothetical protein
VITLDRAIEKLEAEPLELRRTTIASLGVDAVRDAWRSSPDPDKVARLANLVVPRVVMARGLGACIRDLLSRLGDEPALDDALAAMEAGAASPKPTDDVEQALDGVSAPPVEDLRYNAFATIINLHKFLFTDEAEGLKGVIYFCTEGALSRDIPTWDMAARHVAARFRDAIGDPFEVAPAPSG